MKKFIPIFVFLALTVAATVYAADEGTLVVVTDWVPGQPIKVVKVTWTSTAAGEVWGNIGDLNGKVFKVRTDPSAAAGLVPTDNYDIYIKDYEAPTLSYLTTTLENRDTANVEMVVPANVPMYAPVGFSVSASGDVTSGDCWLYVEVPK